MKRFMRRAGESFSKGAGGRRLWLALSVTLLALLAWGGSVSAASLSERVKPEPGVLITAVGEEMPAALAGVARGDILLAIDGDMVNTAAELRHVVLMRDPGDMLELTLKRGGEELTVTVTLGDRDGYPLLGVATHVARQERMRPQRGRFFGMRIPGGKFGMGWGMRGFHAGAEHGATVMEALEEGPAAAAGVMTGDVIKAVDGTEIAGVEALLKTAAQYSPGDEVQLTVDRDGETVTLTVTLAAHPDDEEKAYLGARIAPTARFRLEMDGRGPDGGRHKEGRFEFPQVRRFELRRLFRMMTDGALVMELQEGGPAANAELAMGDVITAVDGTTIAGFEELVEALANYSPGDQVEVTVDRDGETITITVSLGAHPDDETKAYLGVMIMPVERFRIEMEDNQEQAQEEQQRRRQSESDS